MRVKARSISRSVAEWLEQRSSAGRVSAVFERSFLLVASDSQVTAVVLPGISDGPINIVVDARPSDLAALEPGMPAALEGGRLQVGALEVCLESGVLWEPCPDWQRLRARVESCSGRLALIQTLCARLAPTGTLLMLTDPCLDCSPDRVQADAPPGSSLVFKEAWEAAATLRRGWVGDVALLQSGAVQLAGLGGGLTPAGDDFLCGFMLWAWLDHPNHDMVCGLLLKTAAPRTTILSAAFLRAAARGECSPAWQSLLAALSGGTDEEAAVAVQKVLAYGATSGADALAGFLWAGLCGTPSGSTPQPPCQSGT